MSTVKSIYLQHLNGTTPNATMDTNGNFTVGGTVSGASSNMFRNRLINGAMVIDQRNAGASVTQSTSTGYTVDRWACYGTQASKFTVQQNAAAVTPPVGYSYYLGCTSSSAYSITSTDRFQIAQPIEGINMIDLAWGTANAKTVTLSFWVYSSLTGTFGGSVFNYDGSRSCPFSYTISSANTWTYITVTITGDTTGTWYRTAAPYAVALNVLLSLGSGSTLSGTAGTWAGAFYTSATGATSVVGVSGATFYVTGIQFEIGSTATPFEFRHFTTELQLCQRYYEKSYLIEHVPGTNTTYGISTGIVDGGSSTAIACNITYRVTKRTAPSVSFWKFDGTANVWARNTDNASSGTLTYPWGGGTHGLYRIDSSGQALSTTYMFHGHWVASAEL